jgi:hypothetical protein
MTNEELLQSVCKHCPFEVYFSDFYKSWLHKKVVAETLHVAEPVAEPASTGEPECGQFTGATFDGTPFHCKKPRGHNGSCNPLHGIVFAAARPAEPSATERKQILDDLARAEHAEGLYDREPSSPEGITNDEKETEKETGGGQANSEFGSVRSISCELPVRLTSPQTSAASTIKCWMLVW